MAVDAAVFSSVTSLTDGRRRCHDVIDTCSRKLHIYGFLALVRNVASGEGSLDRLETVLAYSVDPPDLSEIISPGIWLMSYFGPGWGRRFQLLLKFPQNGGFPTLVFGWISAKLC